MRFGALRSGAMFVTAFAALFAALSVGAPAAKSQVGLQQRMTFMHHNPQLHFSVLDPTQPPTAAASEAVGKFLFSTSQSSKLVEGHPYPNHLNPDYLYGVTADGFTIRRVGQSGTLVDTVNFGNLFTRVTGATLVTNQVSLSPQWQPRGYDLKEHFVLVGEVNQTNPNLQGNSTGMMLVNPKTMAGYNIGNAPMFLGPTSNHMFEDVTFGVWPGPDADYSTTGDNEYRYVAFMSQEQSDDQAIFCLSLNEHETMNGLNPPSPWNPVVQERGPAFTNVFPLINSNTKTAEEPVACVDNGQMYLRSWFARPSITTVYPPFAAPTDVTYALAGYVVVLPTNPITWQCRVRVLSLGLESPIQTFFVINVSLPYYTDDIFKGMTVVGDWLICSVGDGNAGDLFADSFTSVYIPALVGSPVDPGVRGGLEGSSTAGTAGFVGYHVNVTGSPIISYVGPGAGSSIARGTTRDPFLDHGNGLVGDPMTNIDMHTEEEKLLGLNFRRSPQPFVGFWFSEDPAVTFPGFRDGGGSGDGGCSGSAGGGVGHSAGLLALLGLAFLVTQLVRRA